MPRLNHNLSNRESLGNIEEEEEAEEERKDSKINTPRKNQRREIYQRT